MSCNSSTFSSTTVFLDGDAGGTRLLIQIADASCTGGVTAGDVIHYDALTNYYTKSIADNPPNSEVFGIVESVNIDGSKNVIIYGSINLPSSAIEDIPVGSTGAGGGSDIYFLSPDNAGKLRNTSPTELTQIIKPIYQTAPHGNGSYTGIVMNYIGYKVPSEISIYVPENRSIPIGSIEYYMSSNINGESTISSNYAINQITTTVIGQDYLRFKNKYSNRFGKKFIGYITPIPINRGTVSPVFWPAWNPEAFQNQPINCRISDPPSENGDLGIENLDININQGIIYFDSIVPSSSVRPDSPLIVNGEYFIELLPSLVPIGGFRLLNVQEYSDLTTVPSITNPLRGFSKTDQDNNTISNAFDDTWITLLLKIKNQPVVNNLQILQATTVNTSNLILNGSDIITTINDLESRIEIAEQQINR